MSYVDISGVARNLSGDRLKEKNCRPKGTAGKGLVWMQFGCMMSPENATTGSYAQISAVEKNLAA